MIKIKKLILEYWPLILIISISLFLFIFKLGRDPFWDWDECIYSVYGREMKITGNFLTNQWNGLLGFEKPPFYAWLLQIPFSFGINEFNSRIISVIAGIFLMCFIYIFSKKYFTERVAILSILFLLASEVFILYVIRVNTDIVYLLFVFLGFYSWILSKNNYKFSYLSGVFFGLAVMDKGLSVLAFLVATFFSIFINFKKNRLKDFIKMLFSFFILIAPWHLYQLLIQGNYFIKIYIKENLIQRANNPIEFHFGGNFFYIKQLLRELVPWIFASLILPIYYIINKKKFFNFTAIKKEFKNKEMIFIILIFILIPLLSITRIQTKLPWYALPIYPFLCIFIAYSLDFLLKKLHKLIFYGILFFLILDVLLLINKEIRPFQNKPAITPRHEVFIKSNKYPQKTIEYLVQYSERRAKEVLAPNLTTSTTFIYGGNPCAVYYSNKKIIYYYTKEDFLKRLHKGNGLYAIENGDTTMLDEKPKTTLLFRNSDFTLFKN